MNGMSIKEMMTSAAVGAVAMGGAGVTMIGFGPAAAGLAVAGAAGNYLAMRQAKATSNYIYNGCGAVYHSIKKPVLSAYKAVCATIYQIADSTAGWVSRYINQLSWVQDAYKKADSHYVNTCGTSVHGQHSMDLRPLYQPVAGGVATQKPILEALSAYAAQIRQSVSQEEITRWVALGERLIQVLNDDSASQVEAGMLLVPHPQGGEPVAVQSSVHNMRAIMWYLLAQALRNEVVKLDRETCGHARLTPAVMENMVRDLLVQGELVFYDKQGKLFRFLEHAKIRYTDRGELMNQESVLRGVETGNMRLFAIDDISQQLPARAKRILFNLLRPAQAGQDARIALKFEHTGGITLEREGHEPYLLSAARLAQAAANRAMYVVHGLAPVSDTQILPQRQERKSDIHTAIVEALAQKEEGDASWSYNRDNVRTAMQRTTLENILPYLIFDENSFSTADPLRVLTELDIADRDSLKKKIYSALRQNVLGDLLSYVGSQTEMRDFWRTRLGQLKETLLTGLFAKREEAAQAREAHQYRLTSWWYAESETLKQQKAHEKQLYETVENDMIEAAVAAVQITSAASADPVTATAVAGTSVEEIIDEFTEVEETAVASPSVEEIMAEFTDEGTPVQPTRTEGEKPAPKDDSVVLSQVVMKPGKYADDDLDDFTFIGGEHGMAEVNVENLRNIISAVSPAA